MEKLLPSFFKSIKKKEKQNLDRKKKIKKLKTQPKVQKVKQKQNSVMSRFINQGKETQQKKLRFGKQLKAYEKIQSKKQEVIVTYNKSTIDEFSRYRTIHDYQYESVESKDNHIKNKLKKDFQQKKNNKKKNQQKEKKFKKEILKKKRTKMETNFSDLEEEMENAYKIGKEEDRLLRLYSK